MKTWLLVGAVVALAGPLRISAQSPATDVTFRGLVEAKNIGEYG